MIAVIFAAAMSSLDSELTALTSATVIDFYKRYFRTQASDTHYLAVSRVSTFIWGGVACVVALYAGRLGSLIEAVNQLGSLFYGSLLGVFLLAFGVKSANGNGAFVGTPRRNGFGVRSVGHHVDFISLVQRCRRCRSSRRWGRTESPDGGQRDTARGGRGRSTGDLVTSLRSSRN